MKYFMIKYQFKAGTAEQWHGHIARFIEALDTDPDLKGKISYRCMKQQKGDGYYHIVAASDDAPGILNGKAFFKPYQEQTRLTAGGEIEVIPLELIDATDYMA